jgi:hypothetical protein
MRRRVATQGKARRKARQSMKTHSGKAGSAAITTIRTVDLDHEQLLMIDGEPGTRVRVLYGTMWLTQTGVAQDAFVGSGGEVEVQGPGKVVVEGVGPARVQLARTRTHRRRGALVRGIAALLRRLSGARPRQVAVLAPGLRIVAGHR